MTFRFSSKALTVFVLCVAARAFAVTDTIKPAQADYERTIHAVVRAKNFYKEGRLEIAPVIGIMPFNSLISHYAFGGRLTWHLHDHFWLGNSGSSARHSFGVELHDGACGGE